ncbi:DUF805 domain-containing protein [Superficieibacter sp.]|uniref:DUF805 domain-containing protein n=1 Tax=Superficieibacter sp. TaxID=2303322 RepID=UPI0028B1A197|nr:DUF805 domain-containing protein [Superficieibacter sp.]
MMKWFWYCLKNYATWDCRGHRREYACFNITLAVISFLSTMLMPLDLLLNFVLIWLIVGVLLIVPVVCSHIRRLHDLNWSGWWTILIILLGMFPLGSILLTLTLSLLPGTQGMNRFGAPPR